MSKTNITAATAKDSFTYKVLIAQYKMLGVRLGNVADRYKSLSDIVREHVAEIQQRYQRQCKLYTPDITYDDWAYEYTLNCDYRHWDNCDTLCNMYPWWAHWHFRGDEIVCPIKNYRWHHSAVPFMENMKALNAIQKEKAGGGE